MNIFGDRLRTLRDNRGMLSRDLAKALQIPPTRISNYLNGKEPDFLTLGKIADYFDVSIDYLLGRSTHEKYDEVQIIQSSVKPCPFCGGDAVLARISHIPTRNIKTRFNEEFTIADQRVNDGFVLECVSCGAQGPYEYTNSIQTKEIAWALWNKRKDDINN